MCSISGVSEDGQDTEGVMRFGKTKDEIDDKGCYGCDRQALSQLS